MAAPIVVALNPTRVIDERPGGVMGSISWSRLAELLGKAGEVQSRETITHFIVHPQQGLQYRIESSG